MDLRRRTETPLLIVGVRPCRLFDRRAVKRGGAVHRHGLAAANGSDLEISVIAERYLKNLIGGPFVWILFDDGSVGDHRDAALDVKLQAAAAHRNLISTGYSR